MDNKIIIQDEAGEIIELYVLEITKQSGVDYILASETKEGDAECYILKDVSASEDEEAIYEFVEDDEELEAIFDIFLELTTDMDIDLEK